MKAAALALMLLSTLAVGMATGRATKKAPRHCATGGHTIAKTRRIRVFRVGSAQFYSAYACVLPRGRVRHLGDFEYDGGGEWDGVYGFVAAGKFVAYEGALCDRSSCGGSIKAFNVVSRKTVHRSRIPPGGGPYFVLRLNSDGSVAWTRDNTVWKCDRPKCLLLDRNDALLPYSLSLHGHTLRWSHADGTSYSATLK